MIQETSREQIGKFKLASEVKFEPISAIEVGIDQYLAPKSIYAVAIKDPYIEFFPGEVLQEIRSMELDASNFAMSRRLDGAWERKPRTAYVDDQETSHKKRSWGDPVSQTRFFGHLNSPSLDAWRAKIPSAASLADLSDTLSYPIILDKEGNSVPVDETTRRWLSLCTDAAAIRGRSSIMAEIVRVIIENGSPRDEYNWLSIACGTALPAMQGSIRAGIRPNLFLADFDNSALELTASIAKEIGFQGTINRPSKEALGKDTVNIFNEKDMNTLVEYLATIGKSPTLIDLMGIFEYTGGSLGVDSVGFLKNCFNMLQPGGKLIFGQMRSDRPVTDFLTGVVCWPYIEMRSPRDFMDIIYRAGISPLDTSIYLPDDGVYTIGVITKRSA